MSTASTSNVSNGNAYPVGPGCMFGAYRVVRQLGKGGMGGVWLLKSDETGEIFAAKILDPGHASEYAARRRFAREAEIAMGDCHPNVVRVFDVGCDPDTGLCYIIMEFMHGGTLADRLDREGPLPVAEALRITREVAKVLEWTERKKVVHRDIKPANILFGVGGCVKVADFGVASVGRDESDADVTMGGEKLGTVGYMSPEQMIDSHNVDIRSDMYSLGIVLYEMLAGVRPNKGATAVQMLAKAIAGERVPDVRKLRGDVPADVAELLSAMLAPDAAERTASPAMVAQLCDACINAERSRPARHVRPREVAESPPLLPALSSHAAALARRAAAFSPAVPLLHWIVAAAATAAVFLVSERIDLDALGASLSDSMGLGRGSSAGGEVRR